MLRKKGKNNNQNYGLDVDNGNTKQIVRTKK